MHRVTILVGLLLGSVLLSPVRTTVTQAMASTPTAPGSASPVLVAGSVAGELPVAFVREIALQTDASSAAGGVAVDDHGTVYIIDTMQDQIQVFDRTGQAIATWGTSGTGPGQFQFAGPAGYWGDLALGPDGNLYVVDTANSRIQVLTPDGSVLRMWGQPGREPGQFATPMGITVDGTGRVYVVDTDNARLQVFDGDGTVLAVWATSAMPGGPFRGLADVAVDAAGQVWVTDYADDRVYRLDADGTLLGQLGGNRAQAGQITGPWGLAVDATDTLFVAEYGAHRIQGFTPSGASRGTLGTLGWEPGEFKGPIYLTVGANGLLYVADEGNARVQVFRLLPPLAVAPATPLPA